VAALLGAAAVVLRKRSKAQQAERELWTEATGPAGPSGTAPDLR
jgi:hypothetical protein